MKSCKICNQEKGVDELVKQVKNKKVYYKNICCICYNKKKRDDFKKEKLSKIKTQFKNCNIIDNDKIYSTNNLSESDINELKNIGYGFIFK